MANQIARPFSFLRSWLGGGRLLLLAAAVAVVAGGLVWESQRHPPTPAGALQVSIATQQEIRQTTFRYSGSVADIRAF